MRSLRNGLALVTASQGLRGRIRAIIACVGYAFALARHGKSRPYMATLLIDDMSLTLDWSAAEHVPIREVLIRREYAPDASWLPHRSDTVVDVGANAGVFAVDAARRVGPGGRVVAVEPNPAPLRRLTENARANECLDRMSLVGAALGESAGSGVLVIDGRNSTTGRVIVSEGGNGTVATTTLDRLAEDSGIDSIDLLKIDVEGAELAVLRGGPLILTRTRRAVVEVGDEEGEREVRRLLLEAGFENVRSGRAGVDSGAVLVFASRS